MGPGAALGERQMVVLVREIRKGNRILLPSEEASQLCELLGRLNATQGAGQGQRLNNTLALPLSRGGIQAIKQLSVLLLVANRGFFNRHPSRFNQGCCLGRRSHFKAVGRQFPYVGRRTGRSPVAARWSNGGEGAIKDKGSARVFGINPSYQHRNLPSEMFTTKKCRSHMLHGARWQVALLAPPVPWKILPYQFRIRHQVLGEVQKSRSGDLLVYLGGVIFQFHSMLVAFVSIGIS